MTGFSSEWLELREDADRRSRNRDVANALSGHFSLRGHVSVIDLGAGTGTNLRYTAPLLPARQTWLLVDKDATLLQTAKGLLKVWADQSHETADTLTLAKDGRDIRVQFLSIDLASGLAAALEAKADLITSSAFFDLASGKFIHDLVAAAAAKRAAIYAALTYNGIQAWSPHRPLDNRVTAAFHRHQLQDKGFGPAAGPMAATHLSDELRICGYTLIEGDSPWRLDRNDRMLIEELVRGHAMAVSETGLVDAKDIEAWVKVQRTGAVAGHTDIFAAPGETMDLS